MDEEATAVAIVGAGPAGLVLGHLLHGAGIPFVLVDRRSRADLGGLAKAGAIEYRTVKLLTEEGIAGTLVHFTVENHRCEFRTADERVVFDYGAMTGGRPHYIYPQHELVMQLSDALVAVGADVRFETTVSGVHPDGGGVAVSVTDDAGRTATIRAELAVGCDGARSAVAGALTERSVVEEALPVRWLALIGNAPPLEPHTIYAAHPRGFAGQVRRGATFTRFYLEVPVADTIADWPEARVRDELSVRLDVDGRLDDVAFVEATLVDLRTRMTSPMQQGPVFLAGDAAHLITPAGGKGMNLAIQDAVELAHGLIERLGPRRSGDRLDAYSSVRLPAIWRTQAFSSWMLRLILAGSEVASLDGRPTFGRGVREGWVYSLQQDPLLARWFAHAYAGVDPD
ncbi:MAG TPA: FAD-dependent monooxygenase [Acidimicrobiales bacterium]